MTTRSSARFCHLEMVSIFSAAMMVMMITTITITMFNFISLWRWKWGSSQAILFVSSHLYPHLDQTKQPPYTAGKWHWECFAGSITATFNLFCVSYTLERWRLDGASNSSVCNCEPCFEMMKYVTSFLATSKQHLIIISRRLHQFFSMIAPVIRIFDDDHLPRKCFAHIRHPLLDLESFTFDFERLDVEIFRVLTLTDIYTIMICAHVTICAYYLLRLLMAIVGGSSTPTKPG